MSRAHDWSGTAWLAWSAPKRSSGSSPRPRKDSSCARRRWPVTSRRMMRKRMRRTTTDRDGDPAAVFEQFLSDATRRVDAALDRHLPREKKRPPLIHRAMRYTALAEGKRLRPALVLLAYEASGGKGKAADDVAAAVEMVHAFSLIHDDLPAMDDDSMRRGKPSNHVVFGEGVAILAGDGLLTLAFQTLAGTRSALGADRVARLID